MRVGQDVYVLLFFFKEFSGFVFTVKLRPRNNKWI